MAVGTRNKPAPQALRRIPKQTAASEAILTGYQTAPMCHPHDTQTSQRHRNLPLSPDGFLRQHNLDGTENRETSSRGDRSNNQPLEGCTSASGSSNTVHQPRRSCAESPAQKNGGTRPPLTIGARKQGLLLLVPDSLQRFSDGRLGRARKLRRLLGIHVLDGHLDRFANLDHRRISGRDFQGRIHLFDNGGIDADREGNHGGRIHCQAVKTRLDEGGCVRVVG